MVETVEGRYAPWAAVPATAAAKCLPQPRKALDDSDEVTVGTAARAIDALDPESVGTRLKDLLDRLGTSPASGDRLQLEMGYGIACRNVSDTALARDLRHWMLVVHYTGREEVRVGDALWVGRPRAETRQRSPSLTGKKTRYAAELSRAGEPLLGCGLTLVSLFRTSRTISSI